MQKTPLNDRLKIEQEKLRRLGDKTIRNGKPLISDGIFMAQNRKVDDLVVKIIEERQRNRKNSGIFGFNT